MPENTGRKQGSAATQFKPGQSGNPAGKPKGSKHKLGEAFVAALCADFSEHGESVIQAVRIEDPAAYMRVIASVIPKDMVVTHQGDGKYTKDELRDILSAIRAERSARGIGGGSATIPVQAGSPGQPDLVH